MIILIGYLCQSITWSLIIEEKIKKLRIESWFLSLVGKYLPLKLGVPLIRASEDFQDKNVDTKKYFFSVLKEVLLQVISGTGVVLIYLFSQYFDIQYLITVAIYCFIIFFIYKKFKSKNILIFLTSTFSYIFLIIAINLLLETLDYSFALDIALAYIGVSIISLLFVGSPAGIGIREYLLILFFKDQVNFINIDFLQIAILLRLIFITTDLLGFLIFKIKRITGS
tara:strand:+ start:65 stop:739 length:675 start_codon:yes stop_codon:yes gene_type:complete